VLGQLLRKLLTCATYLGEPVEAAVITVPAYSTIQRQATRDGGPPGGAFRWSASSI